mmetsp:Transcript_20705/g.57515  ORF Transcript_20705/g.57515 Transcript_20705/m.57515 type:complete len:366 (-) Transcript_20705:128-1225(-)
MRADVPQLAVFGRVLGHGPDKVVHGRSLQYEGRSDVVLLGIRWLFESLHTEGVHDEFGGTVELELLLLLLWFVAVLIVLVGIRLVVEHGKGFVVDLDDQVSVRVPGGLRLEFVKECVFLGVVSVLVIDLVPVVFFVVREVFERVIHLEEFGHLPVVLGTQVFQLAAGVDGSRFGLGLFGLLLSSHRVTIVLFHHHHVSVIVVSHYLVLFAFQESIPRSDAAALALSSRQLGNARSMVLKLAPRSRFQELIGIVGLVSVVSVSGPSVASFSALSVPSGSSSSAAISPASRERSDASASGAFLDPRQRDVRLQGTGRDSRAPNDRIRPHGLATTSLFVEVAVVVVVVVVVPVVSCCCYCCCYCFCCC